MSSVKKYPLIIFIINVLTLFIAYYAAIFFHESGHGVTAWLFGVKESPFDFSYEGWLFINANENVNYAALISMGHGLMAAAIGIAGPVVSLIFLLVSFALLNTKNIQTSTIKFSLLYWFLIINMIPLVQYLAIFPFAVTGDTAEFVRGTHLTGWCVFVPGMLLVAYALRRILCIEIIRAYSCMPLRSILGQNLLLMVTLGMIFLIPYSHGFNPFTNTEIDTYSRILSIASILLAPILFILCNPARAWVKQAIAS